MPWDIGNLFLFHLYIYLTGTPKTSRVPIRHYISYIAECKYPRREDILCVGYAPRSLGKQGRTVAAEISYYLNFVWANPPNPFSDCHHFE